MKKSNLEKIFEEMVGGTQEKMVKVVPATKEQIKKYLEQDKLGDEAQLAYNKYEAHRRAFWSSIEIELNDYRHMKFNRKTNEIEIYDSSEDGQKGNVRSPFID